jgi:hypothetical protein
MCIRGETREKARRSLAFSRVSKPHTHITHMLRQCTSIVYIYNGKKTISIYFETDEYTDINSICFHISSLLSLHLAVIYYIGVSVAQSLVLCSVL